MNGTNWMRVRTLTPSLLGLALVGLVGCGGGEPAEEVEEAPVAEAPAAPEAPVVEATELGTNAAAHVGMAVRVVGVKVSGAVGTNAAWVELPTAPQPTQFLVHGVAAPAAGTVVDVVGTVTAITPELVAGWVTSGEITENDKLVVEFATHYLEATSVQPAAAAEAAPSGM